jgi:hypothetical protein
MSSVAEDLDPAAAGDQDESVEMAVVARSQLQELEIRARRGALDARNVELLQDQVKALEGALEYERARSDKQAEAFADLARTCDNRVGDLEAQYKEKVFKLEALVADKDATIAEQRRTLAAMAASQAAITAELRKQTSEIESRYDAIAAAQASHLTLSQRSTKPRWKHPTRQLPPRGPIPQLSFQRFTRRSHRSLRWSFTPSAAIAASSPHCTSAPCRLTSSTSRGARPRAVKRGKSTSTL